jgi:protein-S-isoprenylcysteine O-methyltransferase Ste14
MFCGLSLFVLVVWQFTALVQMSSTVVHGHGWNVGIGLLRGGLYTIFLSIAVVALFIQGQPSRSDDRFGSRAVSILATFLLIVLGLLAPLGPSLLRASLVVEWIALVTTLIGVTLALCAVSVLGTNFSFWPEARRLVVRGPYRFVRHPIYLAEILMSTGVLIANPRLTMVIGECLVVGMQIVRVGKEERLLATTFPTFDSFTSQTHYRILPGIW